MGEHDRKGDRLKCCLHKDGAKKGCEYMDGVIGDKVHGVSWRSGG